MQTFKHDDGRTVSVDTMTQAVTLRAMGFRLVKDGELESIPHDAPPPAYPQGVPVEDWSHAELDAYAGDHGADLTGSRSKAEKVAAITAAREAFQASQAQHEGGAS